MRRKTTAKAVAEAAGVSPATVDRVLNDRGNVSLEKQRLVLECAARLGLDRDLKRRPSRLVRIAVVMPQPKHPFYTFFDKLASGFAKANRIFFDLNIQTTIHHSDMFEHARKPRLIEDLASRYDALIMVSADHDDISRALQGVAQRRPIVTLASDLPNSGRLRYVGPDNHQGGRLVADLMGRFIGAGGGDILLLAGLESLVCFSEREEGFRNAIGERYPGCRILKTVVDSGRSDGLDLPIRELLSANRKLKGIYNISARNRNLMDAIERLGRDQEIVIAVHELNDRRRELLKTGKLDAVIDQNAEMEALVAVETIAHHFGRIEAKLMLTPLPFTVFFRENC